MQLVNLKKYYPCLHQQDTLIPVNDEIAEALLLMQREENARVRRAYYHKAYFSLDCEDGIENNFLLENELSPEDIFIQREEKMRLLLTVNHLREAMAHLTPVQSRRVYARYVQGLKVREIAAAKGTTASIVSQSLQGSVRKLRRYFIRQNWMDCSL